MSRLSRFASGWRALIHRRKVDQDLDEELRSFFESAVDARVARGETPEAARRAVRLEAGGASAVKESVRDVGWETGLETVWQDVRYAFRILRRARGFATAAIITFAVGIGANSAIFSIVDAAILRPLPYDRPDRLVTFRLHNLSTGRETDGAMPRDFLDWRQRNRAFERIAMIGGAAFTMIGTGEPQQVFTSRVSAGFFELMRVAPVYGRTFTERDETPGSGQLAILSYEFWLSRFGAAPDAVGRTLTLDGQRYEIVGVLPKGFAYPALRRPSPFFVPVSFDVADRRYGVAQSMGLAVVGRLRDGVDIAAAEAEMNQLESVLDTQHVSSNKGYTTVELTPMIEFDVASARSWMLLLLGAVSCVLLIACANVANLFIAHGTTRIRELTVRGALGASRWRIARQLLAESLVITGLGGVAGLAVAWLTLGMLRASLPASIPRAATIALDLRVLGFTVALAVATGLLCGLFPAAQGSRVDLVRGLKDDSGHATASRTRQRVRYGLAWGEVALATMLLAAAGLLLTSFARLVLVDKGLDPSGVVSFGLSFPNTALDGGNDRIKRDLHAILTAVRSQGNIEASLNVTGSAPFEGGYMTIPLQVPEEPVAQSGGPSREIGLQRISDGFFEMLHVPLRAGRYFTAQDTAGSLPVAVVNDEAVRRFWKGQSPIGGHIEIRKVAYEIIGVAGAMRYRGPSSAPVPEAFVPYAQSFAAGSTLLVRSVGHPNLVPAVKAAVWSVNPALPIGNIRSADELFGRATAERRFNMLLVSVFAALAVVIAATGVYGVLSFVVSQRRREIGIRMALGARASSVATMFLRDGGTIVGSGIVTGLLGAAALAGIMRSFLFDVSPRDPLVFGAVATALVLIGLAASWLPARRAAGIDPSVALRTE